MDYNEQLDQLIKNALQEDIGDGDHSTLASIPTEANGKAVLKIKEDGVLAGMGVAQKIFRARAFEKSSSLTVEISTLPLGIGIARLWPRSLGPDQGYGHGGRRGRRAD